jgi:hypothetical protein
MMKHHKWLMPGSKNFDTESMSLLSFVREPRRARELKCITVNSKGTNTQKEKSTQIVAIKNNG